MNEQSVIRNSRGVVVIQRVHQRDAAPGCYVLELVVAIRVEEKRVRLVPTPRALLAERKRRAAVRVRLDGVRGLPYRELVAFEN